MKKSKHKSILYTMNDLLQKQIRKEIRKKNWLIIQLEFKMFK